MKLLILPLLLLGAGWLGLAPSADDAATASDECRATVECTSDGTCVIVCYDENGVERCRQEVDCDRPCDAPNDCATKTECAPRDCAR